MVAEGGREDHSTGFVQAKQSTVKFRVLLEKVKDVIFYDNNKQNIYLQYIIVMS